MQLADLETGILFYTAEEDLQVDAGMAPLEIDRPSTGSCWTYNRRTREGHTRLNDD